MKKSGYDQFFKAAAQKNKQAPKIKASQNADVELKLRQAMKMPASKAKKPFPMTPIVASVILLSGVLGYITKPDLIETLVKKVEIRFMGEVRASEEKAPAKDAATKAPTAEKDAGSHGEAKHGEHPSKAAAVAEDTSYIEKLRTRKEELDLREKELNQLEEELQRQKVEVDQRIRQLEQMRRDIANVLKERVEADETQVNKLVDLYSSMKPKQAADVIGTLQEDLAVQVMGKMKKKNAAEVMNLLPAEKARMLSEKLTGYKR